MELWDGLRSEREECAPASAAPGFGPSWRVDRCACALSRPRLFASASAPPFESVRRVRSVPTQPTPVHIACPRAFETEKAIATLLFS
eukprot:6177543-Pleurochrysis_carterae.AAC.1